MNGERFARTRGRSWVLHRRCSRCSTRLQSTRGSGGPARRAAGLRPQTACRWRAGWVSAMLLKKVTPPGPSTVRCALERRNRNSVSTRPAETIAQTAPWERSETQRKRAAVHSRPMKGTVFEQESPPLIAVLLLFVVADSQSGRSWANESVRLYLNLPVQTRH